MKIAAFLSLACASPARAVTTCDVGGLDVSTWKETPCVASSKSLPGSFAGAINEGPYRVGNAAVECAWMDRCLTIFVSTRSGHFGVGLGCVPRDSKMVKITIPSTGDTYDMTMAEKLWYEKYCSEAPDEYLPVAKKHGNVGDTPLLECLARSSWSPTLIPAETYEKDKDPHPCAASRRRRCGPMRRWCRPIFFSRFARISMHNVRVPRGIRVMEACTTL